MAKQKYYVVWQGRKTGIFTDWPSTQASVAGFSGASHKSFLTRAEAEAAYQAKPAPARRLSVSPAKVQTLPPTRAPEVSLK